MHEKTCTKCGVVHPIGEFKKHPHYRDGYYGWCRDCRRMWSNQWRERNPNYMREQYLKRKASGDARDTQLRVKFGLSLAEYEAMRSLQGGLCAICGNLPGLKKDLAVDHNHATGKIRGLLCGNCNSGLGQLRDDPAILRAATEYLEKYEKAESPEIFEPLTFVA